MIYLEEDDIYFAPQHVTLVRGKGKNKCVLFFVGQSALEGHVVNYPAKKIEEAIREELAEDGDPEFEDEDSNG